MKYILWTLLWLSVGIAGRAQSIIFTPQWKPQSQFAGYYVAYDKGFYQEAGVEVDIQHPSTSYSAFNRLWEGSSHMITQDLVNAVIEIDRGMPMVNVLQTAQQNPLMIVGRTDSIQSVKDLEGKKVAVWKVGPDDLGFMMDAEHELNIHWVPFLDGINLFVSGAVDATMAMTYNEWIQIKLAGHMDKPFIRFADTDYNFPGEGLYASADFYQQHPEKVKAFAEASKRGWEYVHEHPEEALDIVMKWAEKEQVHTNRLHQQWMLEEIMRLQLPKGKDKPTFVLEKETVKRLSDLLLSHRRIQTPIEIEKLIGK